MSYRIKAGHEMYLVTSKSEVHLPPITLVRHSRIMQYAMKYGRSSILCFQQ